MKLTGAKKAAFIARMKAGRKRAAKQNPKRAARGVAKKKNSSIRKAKKVIAKGFGRQLASEWAAGKKTNRKIGKSTRNAGARRRTRNPEMEEAIALYEQFHGRPPNNINEYELTEEYRSELAELGQLIELRFTLAGDDKATPLTKFGKCQVACTEDGRNLYFIGGNTTVDTQALGIEPRDYVELGVCSYISYHTVKGFHDFEPMIYFHAFGEENGKQPMLLYDGLNECLFIAGGDYKVEPAGIVN
jgi:hypothetical protein